MSVPKPSADMAENERITEELKSKTYAAIEAGDWIAAAQCAADEQAFTMAMFEHVSIVVRSDDE